MKVNWNKNRQYMQEFAKLKLLFQKSLNYNFNKIWIHIWKENYIISSSNKIVRKTGFLVKNSKNLRFIYNLWN